MTYYGTNLNYTLLFSVVGSRIVKLQEALKQFHKL
jgi:hypothetical protein